MEMSLCIYAGDISTQDNDYRGNCQFEGTDQKVVCF